MKVSMSVSRARAPLVMTTSFEHGFLGQGLIAPDHLGPKPHALPGGEIPGNHRLGRLVQILGLGVGQKTHLSEFDPQQRDAAVADPTGRA